MVIRNTWQLWCVPSLQGKQESDSCEPASSILDIYSDHVPSHVSQPVQSHVSQCRELDTEADTSKDVSDIESDCWDDEEDIDEQFSESANNDNDTKQNNPNTNNNKRSIFIQHKKIKKFSLWHSVELNCKPAIEIFVPMYKIYFRRQIWGQVDSRQVYIHITQITCLMEKDILSIKGDMLLMND